MIKEEIKNIKTDKCELRKFGLSVGTVFLLIGLFLYYYYDSVSGIYIGVIAAVLILSGITLPKALKYPYKYWMIMALGLGFVMSRVILTILFYLIVTPTGLLAKLFGKDFLDKKIEKSKTSYWNYRKKEEYQKVFTERQF